MDILHNINQQLGQLIGMTLFDTQEFISFLIRFLINLAVVVIIARGFYYPKSNRRDYMFIFIIMSLSIFMLVTLMGENALNTGAALGLFAIFGIIRYRTEAIPIREMTYLFMLVAVSVVNALGKADYHPKAELWEGTSLVTILLANLVFVFLAWLFESTRLVTSYCSKYIRYDNISLITPDKREELKADLEKRTGLKIIKVEVGLLDFLKDSALIRIYYDDANDRGSSVEHLTKMPRG